MNTNITQQELDLLAGYPSEIEQRNPARYDHLGQSAATICRIKDRTIVLFDKRYRAAREVIDLIARQVGIDPDDAGYWLYAPDLDGSSPIATQIETFLSRSGEKAKLKKRIKELENENAILRSIIVKYPQGGTS